VKASTTFCNAWNHSLLSFYFCGTTVLTLSVRNFCSDQVVGTKQKGLGPHLFVKVPYLNQETAKWPFQSLLSQLVQRRMPPLATPLHYLFK